MRIVARACQTNIIPSKLSQIVTVFTIWYGSASAPGDGLGDPEDWDTKQINMRTARRISLNNPFACESELSGQ